MVAARIAAAVGVAWAAAGCGGAVATGGPRGPGQPETGADSPPDASSPEPDPETPPPGTTTPGATYDWAVTALAVGGRTDGFDLDGDGTIDNAAWPLGALLDPALAYALDAAQTALVVQLGAVDDLVDDPAVAVGLFSAQDMDGDAVLDGGPSVDDAGRARVYTETALDGGAYAVVLADQAIAVGDQVLEAATPVHVAGAPTAASHTGLIGWGVPVDALLAALTELGVDAAQLQGIAAMADLDTDADGDPDALSITLAFDAEAVAVE